MCPTQIGGREAPPMCLWSQRPLIFAWSQRHHKWSHRPPVFAWSERHQRCVAPQWEGAVRLHHAVVRRDHCSKDQHPTRTAQSHLSGLPSGSWDKGKRSMHFRGREVKTPCTSPPWPSRVCAASQLPSPERGGAGGVEGNVTHEQGRPFVRGVGLMPDVGLPRHKPQHAAWCVNIGWGPTLWYPYHRWSEVGSKGLV